MFGAVFVFMAWFGTLYGLNEYVKTQGSFKKYAFNCIFALLIAAWGFIILANGIKGKLMGALLFGVMGWFASFIPSKLTGLISKAKLVIAIRAIVCVAVAFLVFSANYAKAPEEHDYFPGGASGSSHSCAYCGSDASYRYGGDYLCARHYYLAKGMDGDFEP